MDLFTRKKFSDALSRLISLLDKRFEFYDHKIFELGEIAKSNKELKIAEEAFNYLSKNKNMVFTTKKVLLS